MPYGILPSLITVRIQILIDRSFVIGLLNLSMGCRLEVQVQILGQVPSDGELTVPKELRIEGSWQLLTSQVFHIALLQFIVRAHHLGVERDILRQPVQSKLFGILCPFRLTLTLLEGFPWFEYGAPTIVERTTPLVILLIDGCLSTGIAV